MVKKLLVLALLLFPISQANSAYITYGDKEGVGAVVTPDDINEIKDVVNTNADATATLENKVIVGASFSATTFTLSFNDGSLITENISSITNTDNQTITALTLDEATNVLTVTISGGNTETVDLSGLDVGSVADDTAYDSTSWDANTDAPTKNAVRDKIESIGSTGEENVNADWDATTGDAMIENKPTIPTLVSELSNDSDYVSSTSLSAAIAADSTVASKADDTAVMHLTGNEYLTGIKEFGGTVTVPTPTNDTDAATKAYVDANAGTVTLATVLTGDEVDEAPTVAAVNDGLDTKVTTTDLTEVGGTHVDTFMQSLTEAAARVAISAEEADATILKDADIGVTVLAPTGDGSGLTGITAGTDAVITGYVSGAGTVAATDTILEAIEKLDGNVGAVSAGAFTLDTFPVYEDSAHTTGFAVDATRLAVYSAAAGEWGVVALDFSTLSATPTTYTLSGTITDTPATGSTFTIDSVLYDSTDSPISISGLNSATQSIAFTANDDELGNCTATGLTGTADTGPWTVDMSSADVTDLACTVSAAGGSGIVSYVASAQAKADPGLTGTVLVPTHAEGDLLLACVASDSDVAVPWGSDANWTEIASASSSSSLTSCAARTATASEPASYDISAGASVGNIFSITSFSKTAGTWDVSTFVVANDGSGTLPIGPILTADNSILFMATCDDDIGGLSATDPAMTVVYNSGDRTVDSARMGVFYESITTGASVSRSALWTTGDTSGMLISVEAN